MLKEEIYEEEPKLLIASKQRLGKIYFDNIDVLVVDRIGKDISGDGMDPNITGRFAVPYINEGIKVQHIAVLDLTDETHDQSFAMTSSYSNMYLATYLCFHLNELEETVEKVRKIAAAGQNFLDNHYSVAQQIVDEYNFERIVYLGSNTLKGTSQESALKMLELTAGRVVTMYDTPMGFRHGPKSIVDDTTLTVVYLSDEAYTRQYEVDLLKEMSGQRKGNKIVVVMSSADEAVSALADYTVVYDMKEENENILLGLDYILFAQTLAVLKSLSLDITPDNPVRQVK